MKKLSLLVLMLVVVGMVYATEVYNQPFTNDLGDAVIYDAQGAQAWGWVSYDSGCAKMSGYSGSAQDNVDWLITPSLDLTNYTNVALDFREAINFGDAVADEQEIFVSTDYTGMGDPATASWTKLTITGRSSGGSWTFVGVDQVSLSAYDGESSLFIGFKYTSTTAGAATWEIGEIVVTGTTLVPVLNVTTTSLSNFSYQIGTGPSAEQTFGVSGSNLTGNVAVTAPTHYEVSATSGLNFANVLTFNVGAGSLAETTVYVRLKADLPEGSYNNEDITVSSFGATAKTVTCNGAVTPDLASIPALMISEVADPGDNYNARFVELYNASGADIDFAVQTWYFDRQANGDSHSSIQLTGTLLAGETYVIGNEGNINSAYGPGTANLDFGSVTGNGDDGYFLYYNGDENSGVLYDAYGVVDQDGSGEPWEYEDSRAVRTNAVTGNPTWTASEWTITPADVIDCTPGVVDANQALPVTLTSFTATPVNSESVSISWTTESESGMQCYNLYRNEGNGLEWITSQNAVNVTTTTIYSFEDTEVEIGATYEYVLEGVEVDGTSAILGTVSATIEEQAAPQLPQVTLLSGNFPNPFNPATTISFVVKEAETATLTIYDMKGRTISAEKYETGEHAITWDATDYGSGVYFYKLASPSCHEVKKMIMLK